MFETVGVTRYSNCEILEASMKETLRGGFILLFFLKGACFGALFKD